MCTNVHPYLASSLRCCAFITGLSGCPGAPYFTHDHHPAAAPPPPPPLPALRSAQIQKNSFHYHSLAKGHIRQGGVASVSTDASSSRSHPLAVLCVLLSTCPAPPSPPPLGLFNSWHYLSLSPELHALPHLKPRRSLSLPSPSPVYPPRARPSPTHRERKKKKKGGGGALRDSCCPALVLHPLCLPQGETEVETGENTQEDEFGVLTIHGVTRDHAGLYQCAADNGVAPPASAVVQLVVQCEFLAFRTESCTPTLPERENPDSVQPRHTPCAECASPPE